MVMDSVTPDILGHLFSFVPEDGEEIFGLILKRFIRRAQRGNVKRSLADLSIPSVSVHTNRPVMNGIL